MLRSFSAFFSDNLDLKSTPEGLKSKFDFNIIARSSKIDRSHKLNVEKIANKVGFKYKLDPYVSGNAFLTKPGKFSELIKKSIKMVTNISPKYATDGGTSDARFIRKIAPCLEFGLVGKTMHKIDESVSLSDLKKLTNIYQNILENYFK